MERAVSLGIPGEFFIEDHLEPDGLRRVGAGSVILSLPEDWDRSSALEVRLTWAVRDDFPIGEPATPRLFVRGSLGGEGDYYHSEWLHPDELDLNQEPAYYGEENNAEAKEEYERKKRANIVIRP